jgi:HSP20 family molecular chaperone IbpA
MPAPVIFQEVSMKAFSSQSSVLALLLAAAAGFVHAGDCPDRSAATAGNQAQSISTPAPLQAFYADPWAELVRMQAAMEHQFDAMNALPVVLFSPSAFMMPTPVSALQHTQDGYRIEVPLPGFKPEDVHVRLDGQLLSITAATANAGKVGDQDMQSRSSRTFAETLTLPGSLKAEGLKQRFENGVLILTVPGNEGKT